ncbi:MAG: hypothetical protein ACYS8K_10235 [Planctomycetota bacterium]|jgi:hypothetical protein
MVSTAETRIRPSQLSFRVLQTDLAGLKPSAAALAVERYLLRKRSGLAQALEISAEVRQVVIRAWGHAPQEMIREAEELLGIGEELAPTKEIEVDPDEFNIEVAQIAVVEPEPEREILRSRARYFPHPTCEWFEISTGELSLVGRQVLYESEWAIMQDDPGGGTEQHLIPLDGVRRSWRGEWWNIPCLMLTTQTRTYRYGWPAERSELETLFDVGEWLVHLRSLLGNGR